MDDDRGGRLSGELQASGAGSHHRPRLRTLLHRTAEILRGALPPGRGSCTLAFAEEVVREIAHPLGSEESRDPGADEALAAQRVLRLIDAAFGGVPAVRDDAARRLADDPPMLAAFFQNLDLLVDCERGHAGAVAALVAAALDMPAG